MSVSLTGPLALASVALIPTGSSCHYGTSQSPDCLPTAAELSRLLLWNSGHSQRRVCSIPDAVWVQVWGTAGYLMRSHYCCRQQCPKDVGHEIGQPNTSNCVHSLADMVCAAPSFGALGIEQLGHGATACTVHLSDPSLLCPIVSQSYLHTLIVLD